MFSCSCNDFLQTLRQICIRQPALTWQRQTAPSEMTLQSWLASRKGQAKTSPSTTRHHSNNKNSIAVKQALVMKEALQASTDNSTGSKGSKGSGCTDMFSPYSTVPVHLTPMQPINTLTTSASADEEPLTHLNACSTATPERSAEQATLPYYQHPRKTAAADPPYACCKPRGGSQRQRQQNQHNDDEVEECAPDIPARANSPARGISVPASCFGTYSSPRGTPKHTPRGTPDIKQQVSSSSTQPSKKRPQNAKPTPPPKPAALMLPFIKNGILIDKKSAQPYSVVLLPQAQKKESTEKEPEITEEHRQRLDSAISPTPKCLLRDQLVMYGDDTCTPTSPIYAQIPEMCSAMSDKEMDGDEEIDSAKHSAANSLDLTASIGAESRSSNNTSPCSSSIKTRTTHHSTEKQRQNRHKAAQEENMSMDSLNSLPALLDMALLRGGEAVSCPATPDYSRPSILEPLSKPSKRCYGSVQDLLSHKNRNKHTPTVRVDNSIRYESIALGCGSSANGGSAATQDLDSPFTDFPNAIPNAVSRIRSSSVKSLPAKTTISPVSERFLFNSSPHHEASSHTRKSVIVGRKKNSWDGVMSRGIPLRRATGKECLLASTIHVGDCDKSTVL